MDNFDFPEGRRGRFFPVQSCLLLVLIAGIGGLSTSVLLMWALDGISIDWHTVAQAIGLQ